MSKQLPLSETWEKLRAPLNEILINKKVGLDNRKYMTLYSIAFSYVSSMNADNQELYRLTNVMLKDRTAALIKEALPLPDEDLLVFFVQRWEDWSDVVRVIDHLLAYLNRTWIKNQRQSNANVFEIAMTGDVIWRDSMLVGIKERLTGAMLRLITDERNNQQINPTLIRNCLNCYVRMGLNKENPKQPNLDVYKEHFEQPFIHATEVYYTGESASVLHEAGVPFYMRKVENRIKEEEDRVARYLHPTTKEPLITKLEHVCIGNHKDALHAKFVDLLKTDSVEDLKLMYNLLARVEAGLEPMKGLFEKYVKAVGLEAISTQQTEATEKPQVFVNIILGVFRKYTGLIQTAFKGDPGFVAALDKAFREFVNHNAVTDADTGGVKAAAQVAKAPQILGKYCDLILRKGPNNITDDSEMDRTLNDVVSIFKYFPDKDVFMLVYSKLLSKRLINDMSANQDAESNMITKLKAAQGFEYCMKLQRMITDMTLSKDINTEFQNYLETSHLSLPFGFNIFVLATGSWPLSSPNTNFQVPAEVNTAVESFKTFYDTKFQGRRLMYLHQLARAELQMKIVRPFRLQTTTYQMGVLLMFVNTEGPVLFRDMLTTTLLQDKALKVTLLPLVKLKILTCSDGEAVNNWSETTTFTVPKKFLSKRPRINCVLSVQIDDKPEDDPTVEVDQDRVFKLKAAIVRIMKARKTLSHTDLVQETIGQVSKWFQPKVPMIKKTIESLIEQEYLRRAKDASGQDLRTYEYVA
ncbi:cullin A [Pelomyxa schiedti]|nr:cullin A [Pelomyxa schiedti]